MLAASIIPIFIIGIISNYNDQRIITEHVINNLKFFVEKEKRNIENRINIHFSELNLVSNRIELLQSIENYKNFQTTENLEELNKNFENIKDILDDAVKIQITDLNAKILASSKNTEVGQTQLYERFTEIKKSDQANIDFTITNEGQPRILISKVLAIGANQIGVIFVEFEQNIIFEGINANALGETGKISIAKKVSEDEILLIYPLMVEEDVILKRTISMERDNIPIVQAVMKKEGEFQNLVNTENEPVLAAVRYIEKADWGIAANINTSEVFTSLQFNLYVIASILLVISISIILISIFFSKTIAKPINEMVDVSNQIAQGNFNVRTKIRTGDELDVLSRSINYMIESLRKNIKIEKELEDSKKQLRDERINTIGMLAAQIAHDIKNPLHTIKNSTEIIKRQYNNKEITSREISRIDRGIARITHQVDDVLNYINTTRIDFTQESLLNILNTAIDTLKIPKTIRIIKPKNDVNVECDPEKMESVFSNILLNAIQAIESENGQIRINIKQKQDNAIIEFENTGPEIDEEILPRIFEPLYSTKEKGTGLGLVSCKNIIERHGGIITVSTNPVIFKITIPIKH
ncbi:MAG: ATP-binding protein [Nitrosopumilus sp.]|nr:ATP-binding protein [Nitrosopumilus sp.]